MHKPILLISCLALSLAACGGGSGDRVLPIAPGADLETPDSQNEEPSAPVIRGEVVGYTTDERGILVRHEAVSGEMPAMTMMFSLEEAVGADTLVEGQKIRFRLDPGGVEGYSLVVLETLPDTTTLTFGDEE